ncbi:unnamed protein product [Eruca vesicaria subsp. sativa]|uniref:Uncharacterized protein n=1 Tax=Eruca vesicaria subsp. sativa TaxID=29727 RepID=A0ABC8JEA7_ERUVS|nr:unnamed protein product [Eruca vesicaria subsp. sativa]
MRLRCLFHSCQNRRSIRCLLPQSQLEEIKRCRGGLPQSDQTNREERQSWMEEEAMAARYWCHMCSQVVNPIIDAESNVPIAKAGSLRK